MDQDPIGTSLLISLQSSDGNDLLDYHDPDNLVGKFDAYVECDGQKYELNWAIIDNPSFKKLPLSHYDGEVISKLPTKPCDIPGFFEGFRYYVKPWTSDERYPITYFLCFGDYNATEIWKKKLRIIFPNHNKEYDIVWTNKANSERHNSVVTINGKTQDSNVINITI